MKQFVLYTQDGNGLTAFIDIANPTATFGRLFYTHDNQNWTLILNGVSGISSSGCVISIPAEVVSGVTIVSLNLEFSDDNVEYYKVADGVIKVTTVTDTGGGISGEVAVSNFPAAYPLSTSQYDAIIAELQTIVSNTMGGASGGLTDTELRAAPVEIDAIDLDIRNLSVLLDSVTQTLRVSTPYSQPITGPVTDQVLVAVSPGQQIRLIRNAGHIDPAVVDIYPNITLKIGSTTVFRDKMEPGLPWSETVCFEGADGEDLTITIDDTVSVYLNMRYEVF